MKKTVKQSFHCILGILMLEKVENCPALAGKNLSEKIDLLLVIKNFSKKLYAYYL